MREKLATVTRRLLLSINREHIRGGKSWKFSFYNYQLVSKHPLAHEATVQGRGAHPRGLALCGLNPINTDPESDLL